VDLALGWVTGVDDGGCLVVPVGESQAQMTSYAEPFRRHADSMSPGCLVAVDRGVTPAAVVYRWFPAAVLRVDGPRVDLDEPFHGRISARLGSGVPVPRVGQTVYASLGLTPEWRIDATDGAPDTAATALPEIEAFYAGLTGR